MRLEVIAHQQHKRTVTMGPKSIENPQSGDPKSAKWRPMESLGMSYGISDIILKPILSYIISYHPVSSYIIPWHPVESYGISCDISYGIFYGIFHAYPMEYLTLS